MPFTVPPEPKVMSLMFYFVQNSKILNLELLKNRERQQILTLEKLHEYLWLFLIER